MKTDGRLPASTPYAFGEYAVQLHGGLGARFRPSLASLALAIRG